MEESVCIYVYFLAFIHNLCVCVCSIVVDTSSGNRNCQPPVWSSPSIMKPALLCCGLWSGRWMVCSVHLKTFSTLTSPLAFFMFCLFIYLCTCRLSLVSVSWRKVLQTWSKRSFWLTTTVITVSLAQCILHIYKNKCSYDVCMISVTPVSCVHSSGRRSAAWEDWESARVEKWPQGR